MARISRNKKERLGSLMRKALIAGLLALLVSPAAAQQTVKIGLIMP